LRYDPQGSRGKRLAPRPKAGEPHSPPGPDGGRDIFIVDYGLSFNADGEESITQTNESFGNKFLDLPETNTPSGDHRDPRSDVTAICGVLYYSLTGHRPGHLRDASDLPPHRRPGHAVRDRLHGDHRIGALEAILDRGFAVSLASRIASVDELIAKLRDITKLERTARKNPQEVARRATEILASSDRKTLLADLSEVARQVIQRLDRRVNELAAQFRSKSAVHISSAGHVSVSRLVPPQEALPQNPSIAFNLNLAHHETLAQIAYRFVAIGDRGCLYRTTWHRLDPQSHPPKDQKATEVLSFERTETTPAELAVDDLDVSINEAIDFLMRHAVSQGVLD
jgi:hypothetical protein